MKNPLIWRSIQRENFLCLEKLAFFLELDDEQKKRLLNKKGFSLNLPRRLAEKIKKRTLDDPVLKQFVPLIDELAETPGFCLSPTEDVSFSKTPQFLQKYQGRALLITTSACAMHCRFCFRQNFPYETSEKLFSSELDLIKQDPSLYEIILSGGDPLSLSDGSLKYLLDELEKISHIKIVRFHTRFQIGIPERITDAFLNLLSSTRLQVIFVIHVNHSIELDLDVKNSIKLLQHRGIPILSHTVLLKGVNDSVSTLKDLCLDLISIGVIPYYLNQLDKVIGSSHFEVSISKGLKLIEELRKQLPGYAIPRYIQEVPGMEHKTPLVG